LAGRCRTLYTLLMAGFLTLLLPGAWAAEGAQRTKVLVTFEALIPQFSGLTERERLDLGTHVVDQIRANCSVNWPFVDWVAFSEADEASSDGGVWQVQVKAESRSISRPGESPVIQYMVRLRHYVRPAAAKQAQELQTVQSKLYDFADYKPTAKDSLQRDLDVLLEHQFNKEFLDEIWGRLVSQIPIAKSIVLDASVGRVIIPLRRCELKATLDSRLKATFMRSTAAGTPQEGKLLLDASEVVRNGNYKGCISGLVLELSSRPVILRDVFWDPSLVDIFRSAFDIQVFMFTYVKDTAAGALSEEGVLLDDDPCGGEL
jgi:hypothetical protein